METQRTVTTQVTLVRRPCIECDGEGNHEEMDPIRTYADYENPSYSYEPCEDCDGKGYREHTEAMWNALDLEAQLDELRHEMAQDEARRVRAAAAHERELTARDATIAAQTSQIRTLTVKVASREESIFRLETSLAVSVETNAALREQLAAALDEVARLKGKVAA